MEFHPHLDILPSPQRLLWAELHNTPKHFVLYGGTAIALHLGHRNSVDFDFFSQLPIDPHNLKTSISFLATAQTIDVQENTLTCLVDRGGPVKVSFFGLPNLKRIVKPHDVDGLRIASLQDLAGTKAQVVQARAALKDYIDIDALITRGHLPLADHLAAARFIYGHHFEPLATLKALAYFADVPQLPADIQTRLQRAVAAVNLDHLPDIHPVNV